MMDSASENQASSFNAGSALSTPPCPPSETQYRVFMPLAIFFLAFAVCYAGATQAISTDLESKPVLAQQKTVKPQAELLAADDTRHQDWHLPAER